MLAARLKEAGTVAEPHVGAGYRTLPIIVQREVTVAFINRVMVPDHLKDGPCAVVFPARSANLVSLADEQGPDVFWNSMWALREH